MARVLPVSRVAVPRVVIVIWTPLLEVAIRIQPEREVVAVGNIREVQPAAPL
jgi:hypothetical protein